MAKHICPHRINMENKVALQPVIFFIFGGSGDLNYRKLTPALFNLFIDKHMPDKFQIVGIARTEFKDGEYVKHLREGVEHFSARKGEDAAWTEFEKHISYLQFDASQKEGYSQMTDVVAQKEKEFGAKPVVIFYMAVAPQLVPGIVENLSAVHVCTDRKHARIVVEKPFGHDLASAMEMNHLLASRFSEEQIYRIDHYLGKETVQNILALRFANALFEPIWNRNYIDHVQITSSETVGVEGRGGYYEHSGALRDMVQNHILQLLCMIGMEAPVSFDANEIRNKKVDVLHALRKIPRGHVQEYAVRGQYSEGFMKKEEVVAYRSEPDVAPESNVETYAAVKFYIDNWRWQNVPFYVRTGKRMQEKTTIITISFKPAPAYAFPIEAAETWRANRLTIGIQPAMHVTLRFQAKKPGQTMVLSPVNMVFDYKNEYNGHEPEAYETLLYDVMEGDATLFMRADQVEAAWKVVTPIIEVWEERTPTDFPNYAPGTWGPEDAEALISRDGRNWINRSSK
jgi:glucose-6-phosphate 1-dehydrogenase